jgi:hypothetical protein
MKMDVQNISDSFISKFQRDELKNRIKLHPRSTDFITLQKFSIYTLFTRKINWMCPTNRDHLRACRFIYNSWDKDKSFILQPKGDHSIKTT